MSRKVIKFRGEVVNRERLVEVLDEYYQVGRSGKELAQLSDQGLLLEAVLYLRTRGAEPERAMGAGYRIYETPEQILEAGPKEAGVWCQIEVDLFDRKTFLEKKRDGVAGAFPKSDEEAIFLMMQTVTPPDEYGFAVIGLVIEAGPGRSF